MVSNWLCLFQLLLKCAVLLPYCFIGNMFFPYAYLLVFLKSLLMRLLFFLWRALLLLPTIPKLLSETGFRFVYNTSGSHLKTLHYHSFVLVFLGLMFLNTVFVLKFENC